MGRDYYFEVRLEVTFKNGDIKQIDLGEVSGYYPYECYNNDDIDSDDENGDILLQRKRKEFERKLWSQEKKLLIFDGYWKSEFFKTKYEDEVLSSIEDISQVQTIYKLKQLFF